MRIRYSVPMLALLGTLTLVGCEQSTSDKVENKVEDAGHETGQAMERAGENVKDAAD